MHSEKRELAALRRRFSFRFEMIPPERKNIGRTESARPMPPYIIINLYANLTKKDFGFSTQNFHDETNIETKIQITKFSTVYLQIKDYFIRFRDELPFETANPRPPSRKIAAGFGNRNEIVNFEPRQRPTTEQAAYSRSGPNRNAPHRLCGARSSRCRRGRKTYMQNQIPCSTNRSLTKASSCAWKPPSPNDSLRPLLLRAIASAPSRRATNAIGLASKPRSESSPRKRRRAPISSASTCPKPPCGASSSSRNGTNPSQRRRHGRKRRHRCVSYNSNGWPSNPPTRDGVWDVRSPRRRCDGPYDRPRRSDPAAYADMEPPGAAALPQPRIPLLPHADDRHAEQGGDGHEALPQRIRRDDGGIAPHGRPRRDRRMAPHGVPVIGRIGYSSGVSM